MGAYIRRRLLQSVVVVWGVSVLVFFLLRLAPGDPVTLLLVESASPEQIAEARAKWGLDKPIPVQYAVFLGRALQGDLGNSLFFQQPAIKVLMERMPATLQLSAAALLFSLSVAIPVGLLSALKRDTVWDYLGTGLAMMGQAIPPYWLGIMLILVFSVGLGWFPTSGRGTPSHLVLPAITLGSVLMALITRLVRSGMLDVLGEDYVRTARAKGLRERTVIVRHALRNILIPLVTVIGLQLGALFGGAVITESIFAWPGVGRLALQSINARDYPMVQASVLVISVVYVFLNLAVDLLYVYLDPRIRYDRSAN
ncbi:MAG: ABC transporter permease [Caldilineaceae bacterium]|nr:ABC transporter permease [Caldilineaceae bacterium]